MRVEGSRWKGWVRGEVRGLGFEVWGLGFGGWELEMRRQGLGVRGWGIGQSTSLDIHQNLDRGSPEK